MLAAGWLNLWSTHRPAQAWFSKNSDSYYSLQTEGFRTGHLYAAVQPSPALLALPDPYDPTANAPYRIHDMTLWKGHYYLYFGAGPILLLFMPIRLLTGYYVSEPFAVALFCALGFGFAALLVEEARRHWFPRAGRLVVAILWLVLACGTPVLWLTIAPNFYQVPISCAYMCAMAGVYCLFRVARAGPVRGLRWLAAAGACLGFTLACRPNYLLSMALLALPVAWIGRTGDAALGWRRWLRPALWAFIPVTAIGVAILTYNALRFGNPAEFGMRYQLAGQNFLHFTPLSVDYLLPHAGIYLMQAVSWLPRFPFVQAPPDAPLGILRCFPIVWVAALMLVPSKHWQALLGPDRGWFAGAIGILAAGTLLMDCLFFFLPQGRYSADFGPEFVLLGALATLAIADRLGSAAVRILACLPALATVAIVLAAFMDQQSAAYQPAALSRVANRVASSVGRMLGIRYGGLRLVVELPANPTADSEPLFQTGFTSDQRDWMTVHYLTENQVEMGYFHAGLGEITGVPLPIPADRRLVIEVRSSAFLPGTADDPVYAGWTGAAVADAGRLLQISVNGQPALTAALPAYPSRPWDLRLGSTGFGTSAGGGFSGRILEHAVIPVGPPPTVPCHFAHLDGPLHLRVRMPAVGAGFQPLVASGTPQSGILLYLIYGADHTAKVALDTPKRAPVISPEFSYDPSAPTSFTVWLGPWSTNSETSSGEARRLFVAVDGTVLLDYDHTFPLGSGSPVDVATNTVHSGAASSVFAGLVVEAKPMPLSSLPGKTFPGSYGAIDAQVDLSSVPLGSSEPLVCTGKPGAGDTVYLTYTDENHVVVSLDHDSHGVVHSKPIDCDYSQLHRIIVSMGSLFPAKEGSRSRRVFVRFDDVTALDKPIITSPSTADQVQLFVNVLGSSSCGPRFSGKVASVARPASVDFP
ncbi:MAG TPA: hypothetical protein VGG34_04510 [Opitutaceae bacterium]